MSAFKSRSNSLAGLTLDAVLGGETVQPDSPPSPPPLPEKAIVLHDTTTTKPKQTQPQTQTLFDIIRNEYATEGHKDRTTWQIFREKLRLKRVGSAWTSSLHIPTSDILPNTKHFISQSTGLLNGSVNFKDLVNAIPMSDPPPPARAMFSRGSSMRVGSGKTNPEDLADISIPSDGPSSRSFKPQLSRHDSVRDHNDIEEESSRRRAPIVTFVEERQMSAREAVAAQEAAEAAGNSSDEDDEEDDDENEDDEESEEKKMCGGSAPKQTMSLMDLLEETDRQMGLTGSRYAMDDEYEEEEEEEESYEEEAGEGELSCCVCSVKIKGASFSPCGHTFCKLCSKELMAQKGHCPVCSSFVLEFLEIF